MTHTSKQPARDLSLRKPLLTLGVAALGYVGLKSFLGLLPGSDEGFFHWCGPVHENLDVGCGLVDLPVMHYREDSFLGLFSANFAAVRAALPSERLHPVRLPNGRAFIAVLAFNFLQSSIGPYGQVGIAIPCTWGHAAPPLLPLALEWHYPQWGSFVLHLPVTTRLARDAERCLFGYPSFVADMDFRKRPAYQSVRLSEAGRHILTLTAHQRGLVIRDNRPLVVYSLNNGMLLKSVIPCRGAYQVGLAESAGLELGNHPIAEQLRSFEISTTAFFTFITGQYLVTRRKK